MADDLDDLDAWAAEARARDAAESRRRERWLRTQAEEGAEFASVLARMVERAAPVTLTTVAGRRLSGQPTSLGEDFVALTLPGGRTTLVALAALAWVAAAPSGGTATGRRPEPGLGDGADRDVAAAPAALIDVLAQAVAVRPRVSVQTDGAAVTGELRAVGVDVLALETASEPPSLVYVRLRSVYEISFLDSG